MLDPDDHLSRNLRVASTQPTRIGIGSLGNFGLHVFHCYLIFCCSDCKNVKCSTFISINLSKIYFSFSFAMLDLHKES